MTEPTDQQREDVVISPADPVTSLASFTVEQLEYLLQFPGPLKRQISDELASRPDLQAVQAPVEAKVTKKIARHKHH